MGERAAPTSTKAERVIEIFGKSERETEPFLPPFSSLRPKVGEIESFGQAKRETKLFFLSLLILANERKTHNFFYFLWWPWVFFCLSFFLLRKNISTAVSYG